MIQTGKKYYISDYSAIHALERKSVRTALGTDSTGRDYFEGVDRPESWNFSVEVPNQNQNPVPYNYDTFPTDRLIWITSNSEVICHKELVVSVSHSGVETENECLTFQELMNNYKEVNGNPLAFS
jgi:hypothetical protein